MMSELYKQQFITALAKYCNVRHFKDDMFIVENQNHHPFYFWIHDNGGEVLVEPVNSERLPLNIPIDIDSCPVTPVALASGVWKACLAFIESKDEVVDTYFLKIVEWVNWVRQYNFYWDYETDGGVL